MTRLTLFFFSFLMLIDTVVEPAIGQDAVDELMGLTLEEILELDISSASKSTMKVEDAPGIVSVITREDIRNLGAETLGDVLELVPGFTIGHSLQTGLHQTLYVRGSYSLFSETVLFLENGQRLNDPITGGAVSFSPDYPLDRVKQIEIIRGPGSALYGANAFAALINIITDDVAHKSGLADLRAGAEGSMASLYYGGELGPETHFSLGLDYRGRDLEDIPVQAFTQYESENPPPFPIGIPFNTVFSDLVTVDKSEAWNLAATFRVRDLELSLDYEREDAENNWGSGVPTEPVIDAYGTYDLRDAVYRNTVETDVIRLGAFHSHAINDRLSIKESLTYADFEMEQIYGLANIAHTTSNTAGEGRLSSLLSPRAASTLNAELSLEWRPRDGQVLVAGYSFQRDEVEETFGGINRGEMVNGITIGVGPFQPNGDVLSEGERTVNALYAQYNWQISQRFGVTGGVRGDHYSDFGTTVNPRLAMVFSPTDKVNIKALYGQAFRAPTFLETNNLINGGIIPNPDLDPEEIQTVELQLNYRPVRTLRTAISLYRYNIDNVIRQVSTFNPDAIFETQARNQGERNGEGLDLELRYQPDVRKMFFLNYARVESTDTNGGIETVVEAVPERSINFGFVYDFPDDWVLGISGIYRGDWTSQSAIPLPDIQIPGYGDVKVNFLDELRFPDYTILNLHLSWRGALPGTDLLLGIENALDEHRYSGDQHVFTPGGVATGGVIYKLGFRYDF